MFRKYNLYTFVSLAVLGVILLSACTVPAGAPAQPSTISVIGSGQAYGKPDTAVAQVGVQTRDKNAGKAVEENTERMNAIMEALKALGIAEEDIQTSNFSVYANQNYDPSGQPTDTVYVADNTVSVTVRDLTKLGDALGRVIEAGANTIHGVSFTVSDQSALEAEAREQAMADARTRAEQLAAAAGVSLDKPMSISENFSGPIPFALDVRAVEVAAGGGEVPVSGGQIQVQMQVSVTYLIK